MSVQQLHTIDVTQTLRVNHQQKIITFSFLQQNMNLKTLLFKDKIYFLLNMTFDVNSLEIILNYFRLNVDIFIDLAQHSAADLKHTTVLNYKKTYYTRFL